ncbi:MAG: DUF4238 domain-containing protein [Dehalococcoidia bacterium]|nr:DUF4238 domain-containing protein [Dehalococcoidia bacterium]
MTTSKKHHYLPQFYLERFKIIHQEGKYPHIYRIEKSASPKATSPAIKDTGCKTDYHTLDFNNQDKDRQTVENALSKIETDQAHLVDSICEKNKIAESQKSPLAELITTMRFRVPAFKRYIESFLEGIVESTFKTLMHQDRIPKPPREVEYLIQHQGYDFPKANISNWKILQIMFQMAFQSENSSLLEKMKYQLVFAPDGHHFITGDSPVALYHPNYDSIKPYGVGPAFKEIEVTFPISKRLLVKLTWNGEEGVTTVQEDKVQEHNRRSIIMADSQIFTSEVNPVLLEKVALFHKVEAGYKFDSLWYGEGAAHVSRFIPVTK